MNRTPTPEEFDITVQQLTEKYDGLWREFPDGVPEFSRRFTPWQQRENERQLELHLKKLPPSLDMNDVLHDAEKSHISFDAMKAIAGSSILSRDILNDKYFEESEKTTKRFVKEAKEFDPSLSENDIHQALRNLWVFNNIQMIFGREIDLTPSSFAYSLLYPVTDNGLDSSTRTPVEKQDYIRWLSRWFESDNCRPVDEWTEKTAALLRMIEKEYPRREFSGLYLSLRAIHQAQTKSLLLHNIKSDCDEESLTAITIEKGGTSVLVDGFLSARSLDTPEADALFEYGVLLQLVDDLRDVDEDGINGHSSPFSRIAEKGELDTSTGRLLFFVKHCAGNLSNLNQFHGQQIREMIEQSCSFLILETAARHPDFYSKPFLHDIECWMPMRPAFLKELQSKIEMRQTQGAPNPRFTLA